MCKVLRYRGDGDWHLENRFLMRHELLKVADQQLPELAEPEGAQERQYDALETRQRLALREAADKLHDHLKAFPSLALGPVGAFLGKEKLLPVVRREAKKLITFLRLFPEKFEMQDGGTRVALAPQQ